MFPTTALTCATVTLHCWDIAWMLMFVATPYWLAAPCASGAWFMAVWTQATLLVFCARAGTAAASTMASIAANNITFFNSTSSFEFCLYKAHFFISTPQCQHHCHYVLPFSQNFLTIREHRRKVGY